MLSPIFILDTQALRGLRRDVFERTVAYASPISFYEILCHLEVWVTEDGWRRARGNLRKVGRCTLLDDPFLDLARRAGSPQSANPTRFDDPDIIAQVIRAAEDSHDLADFYRREVRYSNGDRGIIDNCARRAHEVLAREVHEYRARCRARAPLIRDMGGWQGLEHAPDEDYLAAVVAQSDSLASFLRQEAPAGADVRARAFSATYPHFGYLIERTKLYMQGDDGTGDLAIDGNDAEDSLLCMHLDLTEPRVLVTNDVGTLRAVNNSLARLSEIVRRQGFDMPILAAAIDCAEFEVRLDIMAADAASRPRM